MNRSIPFALLAGGALLSATAGFAATTTAPAKPGLRKTAATHSMMARRTTTAPGAGGRMVTARLANGKTVTYNCSLAGNAAKQACK